MAGEAWNEDLFSTGLTAVLDEALQGARNAGSLAKAVACCGARAEAVCSGRPMACAAGCPHCCVLNVAILLPEGMIIADRLQESLAPAALRAMEKRLATHRNWGRWMDDEERIARLAVCPLLDDAGRCSVHPVRPLACRGVASLDNTCCREAFNPIISDQERTVPADLQRRAVYDAAFAALARTLRRHGLDDRSIELGVGVLAFLEHPGYRGLFLSGRELPRELWG